MVRMTIRKEWCRGSTLMVSGIEKFLQYETHWFSLWSPSEWMSGIHSKVEMFVLRLSQYYWFSQLKATLESESTTFANGTNLSHLKTHSREKSNKCNQCDFASIQAGWWWWIKDCKLYKEISQRYRIDWWKSERLNSFLLPDCSVVSGRHPTIPSRPFLPKNALA